MLYFKSEQERKIFHFQYLAWSDHSVPENITNTLNFIDHVNKLYKQHNCNSAVTVHCRYILKIHFL